MFDTAFLSGLPLDVYSRLQSLFYHVRDVGSRMSGSLLGQLVNDFEEMALHYIEATKVAATNESDAEVLKLHEVVDTLTREWNTITELIATVDLGRSYLGQFEPYIQQAASDIGIADIRDQFILIPTFGEYFALTSFKYSTTQLSMMKLPLSAITSPWEWSVIWHELGGLKVRKAHGLLTKHLQKFADQKSIQLNDGENEDEKLFRDLFDRILDGTVIDGKLRGKLQPIVKLRLGKSRRGATLSPDKRIWSLAWLEQLLEDACSVLAFGEDFVFVFEKILGRNVAKLTADRKHPDLSTRVAMANRLLALRNGSAGKPTNQIERLTDELLWSFLVSQPTDSPAYVPLAFEKPGDIPPIRRKLMEIMSEFKKAYRTHSPYPDVLAKKVGELLGRETWYYTPAGRTDQSPEQAKTTEEKIDNLFVGKTLDELVGIQLSETDLLDIKDHSHNSNSGSHNTMSINVHNQDHTVYWYGVSHV